MCGIVGMVTSKDLGFTTVEQRIFSQLLWADTLRGDDSTGVFGINKYGNLDYIKNKGHAGELIATPNFREFKENIYSDYHMVVGHNRKATKGMVTDENAHPFIEQNVALVHNGTLLTHAHLTQETVTVDSHAILHSIVERGYEETLKEINGAFALAWYDANDKTLRVIRNDQRPLFIASTVGAWFFASEKGMLEWILGREDVDISEMEECTPGTLYSFKLEDKKNMWYQAMDLYQPPKSNIVVYTAPKKSDDKATAPTTEKYSNTDFTIGTKILITSKKIEKLQKANQEGFTHMLFGEWFFDTSVTIRCWANDLDVDILETTMDDSLADDELIFQADIMCVISKKNKITLVCKNAVPYVPAMGSTGKEAYADEYMFTDGKCSYCSKEMTFDDVLSGSFKFESADDNEIICQHCLSEGKHLPI